MGTCPKCKHRIRRNGNHIKLGSVWYHKACPARARRKARGEVPPASSGGDASGPPREASRQGGAR